jgi:conjugative transfer signal peptidase TraF
MARFSVREALAIGSMTALAGFPLYQFLVGVCGVRFNLTASAPVGVYRVARSGIYLGFCPQGEAARLSAERGYRTRTLFACPDGHAELIKPIVTKPGDAVELSAAGIGINGRLLPESAPLSTDSAGRPMIPYPFGVYYASQEQTWVVSRHPKGYDSRYFGPVAQGERLRLLWTW